MSHGSALERLKKVPGWAWLVSVAVFVVIFGYAADQSYPVGAHPRPLQVSLVAAAVFVYLIPGLWLARRSEKRWGEIPGVLTLFAWLGLALAGAKIAERFGF
jgi:hypothetical protein